MSSLIAKVLGGAASLETEDLERRLSSLSEAVEESNAEVVRLVEEQFLELLPTAAASARELSAKSATLREETASELASVRRLLEESAGKGDETGPGSAGIRTQLAGTEAALARASELEHLVTGLEELVLLSPAIQPLSTARALIPLETTATELAQGAGPQLTDARFLPTLQEQLVLHREGLLFHLLEWWKASFKMDSEDDVNSLTVLTSETAQANGDRLTALRLLGYADQKVEQLGTGILELMFQPLIRFECQMEVEKSGVSESPPHIRLRLQKGPPRSASDSLPAAKTVLKELLSVSEGLSSVLGGWYFGGEGEEWSGEPLLAAIGRSLSAGLANLVLEGCLRPAVPSDPAHFAAFAQLVQRSEEGEKYLRDLGLLAETDEALAQFRANKEALLIDRRCQRILEQGRALILSPVNNLVRLGEEKDLRDALLGLEKCFKQEEGIVGPANEGASVADVKLETERRLPPVFRFPICRVSESVVELVALVEQTLKEAGETEDGRVAGRLCLIARSLVDLFLHLSRQHHQANFAAIPPFAAAYYNNCYYMSHRLMTLGWEVTPKLTRLLDESKSVLNFVDFIPRLRELASEVLEEHIQSRQKLIQDILKDAKGWGRAVEEHREAETEKAVRGAVLQTEQVARVWADVLTRPVYLKSTGRLVGALLSQLSSAVLRVEDMAAAESELLTGVLGAVGPRLEALFDAGDGSEIRAYVDAPYARFLEIQHCLSGSLQSISERWAGGAGPLGTYLSAGEVKGLVRALFQNTERRAAFLSTVN